MTTSPLPLPLRMTSRVVRGFGRGSSDLGIPTANLDRTSLKLSRPHQKEIPTFDDLPCGIYWGFARVEGDGADIDTTDVYPTALSIGYNPTYGNEQKTIEPHLIASASDPCRHQSSCKETVLTDFYDRSIKVSIVGHLRPELPFEGLDKLILAIKNDISETEKLAEQEDTVTLMEKGWVLSDSP